MRKLIAALAVLTACAASPAHAFEQKDSIGLGIGYFDIFEKKSSSNPQNSAADFRAEYVWGLDLIKEAGGPELSWLAVRPFAGLEATHEQMFYGLAGFVIDIKPTDWLVLSPNIGVGLLSEGDGKNLGSFIEFRSTMEAGILFPNQSRLTFAIGHISNAELTHRNPGAEIATVYFRFPADWIFGP